MAEATDESVESEELAPAPRRRRRRWLIGAALVVGLVLLVAWLAREQIADRIVAGQLENLDLPGTYTIEQAGPRRQVLTNLVIGDPARPDLTIERVVVDIAPSLAGPAIGKVTLTRPRLYGELKDGRVSFGALDKVIYAKSTEPFRLPDLDLTVIDGRARIVTGAGPIGLKADGRGNLRSGFAGTLAAIAPQLRAGPCTAEAATMFGKVSVTSERPRWTGPLRLKALSCPEQRLRLTNAAVELDASAQETLDAARGTFGLRIGSLAFGDNRVAVVEGSGAASLKSGDLTGSYKLEGRGLAFAGITAERLSGEGLLRTRDRFAGMEAEGSLAGTGLSPGEDIDLALAELARSGEGTLLASLATHLRGALGRAASGSKVAADYTLRKTGALATLVVPRATLTGRGGAQLAQVSRLELTAGGSGSPRIAGNLATGGPGLPRIEGRFERQRNGSIRSSLRMAEYRSGDAMVAVPQLVLVQGRGGEIGFSGQALISGALPGGRIDRLALPLDGNWSQRRGLSAWRRCVPLRFERLAFANLSLDARTITLCPGRAGALVRSGPEGLRIAAGTPSLALSGRLGSTGVRVNTGAIGLAWPGALNARAIDVELSGAGSPTRLKFAEVTGRLGKVSSGRFSGGEIRLNNVPLDVLDTAAAWRFADGVLQVSEGTLRVEDRQIDDRFRPLIARDATLSLEGGQFKALAVLREPKSDREVVQASIFHAMNDGRGHALLDVPGLVFDRKMQPDTVTALALGIIANARGTVTGGGRIDWTADQVTSTGRFSTRDFDFAAAFGPVKGVSGTVEFSDLIGLVTAPDQRLAIASINPGIEVENGIVSFELQGNNVLMVNGASWPFIDGTLVLEPTRMVLGAAEVRRYTLTVDGANAAKFVERLELSNISATGSFDGTLPLVFDENGGHIDGGLLTSRAPGGNVSYVGELTYKDMGAMANFAFQSLRSLDYRQMRIALDGNLEGDIITRIRLDGVRQGATAKRNFITQRFAKLPIQFNINIRAPFQRLVTTFKSIYDPSYVRDPRELGIIDGNGQPVRQESRPSLKLPDIQAPESRVKP